MSEVSDFNHQGKWTSDDGGETGILEFHLSDDKEALTEVNFYRSGEIIIFSLTKHYNEKSKLYMMETAYNFISNMFSQSMVIVCSSVDNDKITGTFLFNGSFKGKFKVEYLSEEDIKKKREDIEAEKIRALNEIEMKEIKEKLEVKEMILKSMIDEVNDMRRDLCKLRAKCN